MFPIQFLAAKLPLRSKEIVKRLNRIYMTDSRSAIIARRDEHFMKLALRHAQHAFREKEVLHTFAFFPAFEMLFCIIGTDWMCNY